MNPHKQFDHLKARSVLIESSYKLLNESLKHSNVLETRSALISNYSKHPNEFLKHSNHLKQKVL
jgi:hypothetical protein